MRLCDRKELNVVGYDGRLYLGKIKRNKDLTNKQKETYNEFMMRGDIPEPIDSVDKARVQQHLLQSNNLGTFDFTDWTDLISATDVAITWASPVLFTCHQDRNSLAVTPTDIWNPQDLSPKDAWIGR